MSNKINTEYIYDCMKERYKVLFSRKLRFKDKLKTVTVDHGYLLPVKKTDSKYLMGRGGVLDRDGKFVPVSGIYSRGNRIKTEYDSETKPEVYMGAGYKTDLNAVMDELKGESVYLGFVHNHWGHFLIDFSTRLWYVSEADSSAKLVFLVKQGQEFSFIPNIKRFLQLYGIDERRIVFINKVTSFEKLIIPEPSYRTNDYYSAEYLNMFDKIASGVRFHSDHKKIYFSRGVFKKANATEFGGGLIDEAFETAGFKKIYPEQCTLDEQIGYIRGAEVVAGVSGTVTHNMLFAKPGQKLDIINKTYIMNTMQSDINIIKQLDVTYADAYSAYYPVSMGIGPFLFEKTKELKKYFTNSYGLNIENLPREKAGLCNAFTQYMKAYEKLAVNNYLDPPFEKDPDSAHFYPYELMGEAVKLHYIELHGKLRRRNLIRKLLGRG